MKKQTELYKNYTIEYYVNKRGSWMAVCDGVAQGSGDTIEKAEYFVKMLLDRKGV